MTNYYTGIGSRQTPADVLDLMTTIAERLGDLGWTLRSGGAPGADTAFFNGTVRPNGLVWRPRQIFLPWNNFSGHTVDEPRGFYDPLAPRDHWVREAVRIAALAHPAWDKCSRAAKMLHTRNVFQIHGPAPMNRPSRFVICWTSRGQLTGGTATAIRIATALQIPVFNLAKKPDRARIENWLGEPGWTRTSVAQPEQPAAF